MWGGWTWEGGSNVRTPIQLFTTKKSSTQPDQKGLVSSCSLISESSRPQGQIARLHTCWSLKATVSSSCWARSFYRARDPAAASPQRRSGGASRRASRTTAGMGRRAGRLGGWHTCAYLLTLRVPQEAGAPQDAEQLAAGRRGSREYDRQRQHRHRGLLEDRAEAEHLC